MQQINLLTLELAPKSDPLVARHLVMAWCGFGLVLALITGWHGLSLWGLHTEMASTRSAVDQLRVENNTQRQNIVDPQSLRDRIAELREQQLEQDQLMRMLRAEQETAGFSAYLSGLARAKVEGLWLSEISIVHNPASRLTLKGTALDAIRIPELLHNLAGEDHFAGQRRIRESHAGEVRLVCRRAGRQEEGQHSSGQDVSCSHDWFPVKV